MHSPPLPPTDPELLAQMLALQEASPQLIGVFDQHDVLRFANLAFREAFNLAPEAQPRWLDMMRANARAGRGSVVSAPPAELENWLAAVASRRGKQAFRAFEADLMDGRWIWMCETLLPNGWMFCCASDISSLKTDGRALRLQRDQALRAAQTDVLTGISNRAHVLQQLEQQLAGLHQPGRRLAVILLDLDRFKQINDGLGHEAGDRVLCDFARRLQRSTRRGDACGRMGGEEFLLLLADVEAEQARAIVERLLAQLRQSRPLTELPLFRYTCSAGLAVARAGDSARSVCQRADVALYQAKAAGRDRCVLASD